MIKAPFMLSWRRIMMPQNNDKMIHCPTGCSQHRTKSYRLYAGKKTFNTRTQKCNNCGFSKLPDTAKFHGAGFKKASTLPRSGN